MKEGPMQPDIQTEFALNLVALTKIVFQNAIYVPC